MTNNTVKNTKTQDEEIAEFNRDRQPYLDLLKSLDDRATAQKFTDKKLERAKALVSEIFMVTSGAFVEPENKDWAHEHLTELLEIFQIRHENFDRTQFAEDLQDHIYAETMSQFHSYLDWKRNVFAKRGLDEYGVELKRPNKQSNISTAPATEQPTAKTLEEHHLQIMANKISHILQSDKVSDDLKAAFDSIICEAGNEAGIGASTHPELIKTAFPLIINALDVRYGEGVLHALRSLIDNCLESSIEDELRQYEKRFDGRTEDELKVLDLSNSSIEDLSITLSGIMHNPNLPKNIFDCLADNLSVNHIDVYSPENILGNLKENSEAKQ